MYEEALKSKRLMVAVVRSICKDTGIDFDAYSDDWILELKKGGDIKRIIGYQFGLNNAASSAIAKDKVATHLTLKRAGVPSVEHVLYRKGSQLLSEEFASSWSGVVVKPIDGSGGHNVRRFDDVKQALEWANSTPIVAFALSPFIDIKRETRTILLDGHPLITYEKLPTVVNGLKMFNLGLGAMPGDFEPDDEQLNMAINAQEAIGLRLSAVDIIEDQEGYGTVLEVNSGFMMENYGRASEANFHKTFAAYKQIVEAMMRSD